MAKVKLTQAEVARAASSGSRLIIRDTDIQGLVLYVEASGTKTFYVDFRKADGRRQSHKLGRADSMSVAQAREAAKEFLAKLALGQEPDKKPERAAKELTVGAFLDEYYITWVINNRKSGDATAKMLRRSFKTFWDVGVTKITQLDLERWQSEKMKSNKEASVNRVCSTIKAAFNWGVKRGILSDNPLAHVEKLKETTSPGRVRYLSDEERARLFKALELHDRRFHDHLKPMIVVALNTGIRRGSLFGLMWGDIDFEHGTIRLRAEEAKSGKQNYVPMNEVVIDVLSSWQDKHPGAAPTDLAFPSPKGGKRFDSCHSAWDTLMREAEIENFRWHDMRHDFASRLVMSGVDLNTLRELLGHADLKMTLRYAHLAPAAKKKAVDLLVQSNSQ